MAHRQLAEKYAKQLNEANQRIMELETAVADCEVRVEQAKGNGASTATQTGVVDPGGRQGVEEAVSLNEELRVMLFDEQAKLDAAAQRIRGLEAACAARDVEIEMVKNQANARAANSPRQQTQLQPRYLVDALGPDVQLQQQLSGANAKIQELQQQSKAAARTVDDLRGDTGRLVVQKLAAEMQRDDCQRAIATQKDGITKLNAELTEARELVDRESAGAVVLTDEVAALKQEKATLRGQVTKLQKAKAAPKPSAAAIRKYGNTRSKREEEAARAEVKRVTNTLEREKKRRLEMERLLGPDGRRCKKCDPIVIPLE